MDVPVVLLLLWLVRDVLRAPILTVKKMEAALGVPNDGDDEIPSSGSNGAPATSMSNLVHRFQINKITRVRNWEGNLMDKVIGVGVVRGDVDNLRDRQWRRRRRR